jgi:hypothetical protein
MKAAGFEPSSAPAIEQPLGCLVGESGASVGIELLPICSTPAGKLVRVNVYTDDASAATLKFVAALFGINEPLLIGPMEFVAILKHGPQPNEVFGREPDHRNNLNLHATPAAAPRRNAKAGTSGNVATQGFAQKEPV